MMTAFTAACKQDLRYNLKNPSGDDLWCRCTQVDNQSNITPHCSQDFGALSEWPDLLLCTVQLTLPFPALLRSIWESGQERAGFSKRDIEGARSGCQLPQRLPRRRQEEGWRLHTFAAALSHVTPFLKAPQPPRRVCPNVHSSHSWVGRSAPGKEP